jgi:predicted amidophosphoribosyltransferase
VFKNLEQIMKNMNIAAEPTVCPKCHKPNELFLKYCHYCGYLIEEDLFSKTPPFHTLKSYFHNVFKKSKT